MSASSAEPMEVSCSSGKFWPVIDPEAAFRRNCILVSRLWLILVAILALRMGFTPSRVVAGASRESMAPHGLAWGRKPRERGKAPKVTQSLYFQALRIRPDETSGLTHSGDLPIPDRGPSTGRQSGRRRLRCPPT